MNNLRSAAVLVALSVVMGATIVPTHIVSGAQSIRIAESPPCGL